MRLGFHYHVPMHREADGRLRTSGALGVFIDQLASECDELVCFQHSALPPELPYLDDILRARNVTWVDIGPHAALARRVLLAPYLARAVRGWRGRLDAFLIRGPSPLLPAVAAAARPLPIALLLVGDLVASAEGLERTSLRKRLIRTWARRNARLQLAVARRALTLVNSRELFDRLRGDVGALHETRTTTLSESDIFERADTCGERPIQLLYTGRIDPAKGLFEMVGALALLNRDGIDAVLNLVGQVEPGSDAQERLRRAAADACVGDRLVFHGYKPLGPELFARYRQADVYLMGSLHSEGFPRTIWEAMSQSVPVVATRVGSIPHFLEDGASAVLVEPGSPQALADAVHALVETPALRRRVIAGGLALARQNTLERQTRDLAMRIREHVRGCGD